MKKLLTAILLLLTFSVGAYAQDFTFTKKALEGTYMFSGSLTVTGDSITADVQGYLDGNAKDFDAGSIGISTGSTPTETAVTLSKDVHMVRFSIADSVETQYSNYIDISIFATVKTFAKLVQVGSTNQYTCYFYVTNAKGETLVVTPYRFMNQK